MQTFVQTFLYLTVHVACEKNLLVAFLWHQVSNEEVSDKRHGHLGSSVARNDPQ